MDSSEDLNMIREIESLSELSLVILSRTMLIRLAHTQHFDELAKGCYARIMTKTEKISLYALYKIVRAIDTDVPIGKSKYAKRIQVDNGNERTLESVDDGRMTQAELELWIANMRQKNETLPTIQWAVKRNADIRRAVLGEITNKKSSMLRSPDDLKCIVLKRRHILNMILNHSQIPKGCFVRMVVQHDASNDRAQYGMAHIVGITSGDDGYKVTVKKDGNDHGFTVYHRLNLRLVRQDYTKVGLQTISDGPFEDKEFDFWMKEYEHERLLPSTKFVERKSAEIQHFLQNHQLPTTNGAQDSIGMQQNSEVTSSDISSGGSSKRLRRGHSRSKSPSSNVMANFQEGGMLKMNDPTSEETEAKKRKIG